MAYSISSCDALCYSYLSIVFLIITISCVLILYKYLHNLFKYTYSMIYIYMYNMKKQYIMCISYLYVFIYIYIYMYTFIQYVYVYIYIYICLYIYMFIHSQGVRTCSMCSNRFWVFEQVLAGERPCCGTCRRSTQDMFEHQEAVLISELPEPVRI